MAERPILFSGPMVRAIIEGRKTQTRRAVKGLALDWLNDARFTPGYVAAASNGLCPFGYAGDRLWVRETFAEVNGCLLYRADQEYAVRRWTPSIHMPRSACRLVLDISDVRIERLQDITDQDAVAEGCRWVGTRGGRDVYSASSRAPGVRVENFNPTGAPSAREAFEGLWASINGRDSWDANPWVWVVSFRS